jgi:hypothetical protein
MTKSPVVPDPKPGGSRSLQELSHRLLGFGDDAKAASLAIAARSALRTIPLLERLSWDKPLRKKMRAALGRTRMPNSAIVLGRDKSFSAPARVATNTGRSGSTGTRPAGGGELSEKDEIARVSLPNEAWAQGPEFANPSISRLVV